VAAHVQGFRPLLGCLAGKYVSGDDRVDQSGDTVKARLDHVSDPPDALVVRCTASRSSRIGSDHGIVVDAPNAAASVSGSSPPWLVAKPPGSGSR
jgi:hypothetical protein